MSFGMDHSGLPAATASVHKLIQQAERAGIPASRITLAGFSQGGVLALQAGLTYERPLAGIATFSSWLPGNLRKLAKHKATPIFMGHGEEDRTVPFKVGYASHQALKSLGFTRTSFATYKDQRHSFAPGEFDELEAFVLQEIPRFPKLIEADVSQQFGKVTKQCSIPPHPVYSCPTLSTQSTLSTLKRKVSTLSTQKGSRAESPPTSDEERPDPTRLRHSVPLTIQQVMSCASPQASWSKTRVVTNGQSLGARSASVSLLPQQTCFSPSLQGAFRDVLNSHSCQVAPHSYSSPFQKSPSTNPVSWSFTAPPGCRSPAHLQQTLSRG